jgi:hypothetical protein
VTEADFQRPIRQDVHKARKLYYSRFCSPEIKFGSCSGKTAQPTGSNMQSVTPHDLHWGKLDMVDSLSHVTDVLFTRQRAASAASVSSVSWVPKEQLHAKIHPAITKRVFRQTTRQLVSPEQHRLTVACHNHVKRQSAVQRSVEHYAPSLTQSWPAGLKPSGQGTATFWGRKARHRGM